MVIKYDHTFNNLWHWSIKCKIHSMFRLHFKMCILLIKCVHTGSEKNSLSDTDRFYASSTYMCYIYFLSSFFWMINFLSNHNLSSCFSVVFCLSVAKSTKWTRLAVALEAAVHQFNLNILWSCCPQRRQSRPQEHVSPPLLLLSRVTD